MKWIEKIKLRIRASKYKNKNDKGGIAYIHSSLQTGQTAFDIGAHKAGYLYWMVNRVGPQGSVFAFEPQTNLFQYIRRLITMMKWNNVTVEHLALSDSAGDATLYIPTNKVDKSSSPGATLVEHKERNDMNVTESIRTQTLDEYCRHHAIAPHFLKIDVEGNELKALKGGVNTLKTHKPKILVEIEARHIGREKVLETFAYLEALGYKGYIIHGLDRIPLIEFDFEKHQSTSGKNMYCNNFIFE